MSELQRWLTKLESISNHSDRAAKFDQVKIVAKRLSIKKPNAFTMVVAGTNGKGSVVATLEALATHANTSIVTVTSPHLVHYNERFRINGIPVSDSLILEIFQKIEEHRGEICLSYAQMAGLAGLMIAQQADVDLAVIEVGLGGRLSIANIIDNDLTIITNISYDHCHILGYTLEEIAAEKAGIIKRNTPVIFGDFNCPHSIIRQASQSKLYQLGIDYAYKVTNNLWSWFSGKTVLSNLPIPNLILNNTSSALMAFSLFNPSLMIQQRVSSIMDCLFVPGRCQSVQASYQCLLDVAHNEQSVKHLAEQISATKKTGAKVYALFGMYAHKDASTCIRVISHCIDQWLFLDLPVRQSLTERMLRSALSDQELSSFRFFKEMKDALKTAKKELKSNDMLVVFGSFVIIGLHLQTYSIED